MKTVIKNLLLALVLVWDVAYSVKLPNLYEIDMPVASQTSDDRSEATRQGFKQMLTRLTGNPDVSKNRVLREAIERAEYYVQGYSYPASDQDASTIMLHISFEKDDVRRLLKKANSPTWGDERPLIITWLTIIQENRAPEIIGSDTPGSLLTTMQDQSSKMGLPLIFPLMDVEDLDHVTPDNVTLMELPVIETASKRYAPNGYLIGSIEAAEQGYESQWQLVLGSDKWAWEISANTPDEIAALILNQISQTVAKRFGGVS